MRSTARRPALAHPTRWMRLALAGALLLLLSGCSSVPFVGGDEAPVSTLPSASPVLDRVLASGELRVGMSADSPPMNAMTRNGSLMGLEVDLAVALGNSMGVKAVPVKLDFGDLLEALEEGRVDIVLSNMTMTPKRNTKVAFIGPYFVSGKAVLTRERTLAAAANAEQLDGAEVRLAALRGSTSEQLLRDTTDVATIRATDTHDEAIEMVIAGEVHAMVADLPIVTLAILRNPDAGLIGVEAPLTFEPIGAALPSSDALFMNLMTNYMTLLEGTGLMDALRTKWFSDPSWISNLAPTAAPESEGAARAN